MYLKIRLLSFTYSICRHKNGKFNYDNYDSPRRLQTSQAEFPCYAHTHALPGPRNRLRPPPSPSQPHSPLPQVSSPAPLATAHWFSPPLNPTWAPLSGASL